MPTVTEPVRDIRTGEVTGTVTVTVETPAETQARMAGDALAVTNETTIRQQAESALAANKTFLAITSPTTAQIAAQVKALTRQNNGLIRMVLRRFEAAD